jgi:hypothetical protein
LGGPPPGGELISPATESIRERRHVRQQQDRREHHRHERQHRPDQLDDPDLRQPADDEAGRAERRGDQGDAEDGQAEDGEVQVANVSESVSVTDIHVNT